MINPLINDMESLSDAEIEQKLSDLQKKYFMANNEGIKLQISSTIEIFKEEAKARRERAYRKMNQNNNDDEEDLDSLINIS